MKKPLRLMAGGLSLILVLTLLGGCSGEKPQESIPAEAVPAEETKEAETTKAPETEPADPLESYLKGLDADEVVLCIGDGSAYGANLFVFVKKNGSWKRTMTTKAQIGKGGFSSHTIEGDGTTPTGTFSLGVSFGNKSNPGSNFSWFDVNEHLYWIDDLGSEYYNTVIDDREHPDGWNSGEHLIEYTNSYAYSININVNPSCRKDSTSAIFLHCYGKNPYTLGCIAIPESDMVRILTELHPGALIKIVA